MYNLQYGIEVLKLFHDLLKQRSNRDFSVSINWAFVGILYKSRSV